MLVRPETPRDHAAIAAVHLAAFADHPYSRQTEHQIVDALRQAGALLVSLVGEEEGRVVGHVAFSAVTIDGADLGWVALGPVGVLPDRQRRGIGTALVEAGLDAVRAMGAAGCVLVGEPAFYRRFGFRADHALVMEGVPPAYVQALTFGGQPPAGRVAHHPAFGLAD